jgi:Ni/Co efflux regulator RcnB
MKRILAAAVMIALLAAPATAQMGSRSGAGQQQAPTPLDLQYEKERQEQRENERAYNEQMKRLKSQSPTTKVDPWAGVRSSNETTSPKR